MSKKLIALLFILIIAGGIFYTIKQPAKNNTALPASRKSQATPALTAKSTLAFYPGTINTVAGQPTTARVWISTQGPAPKLIQLELAYDPTLLSNVTITPGNFFSNPVTLLQIIDANSGRISYVLSTDQKIKTAKGTVANIHFTPTARAGTTEISFQQKTMVRSDGAINTLTGTYGATVDVTNSIIPQASVSGVKKY